MSTKCKLYADFWGDEMSLKSTFRVIFRLI